MKVSNIDSIYYDKLLKFGNVIPLKIRDNPQEFLQNIQVFNDNWRQYNPNKDIKRKGLSITSLEGKFEGPDLDTIGQSQYDESSFRIETPAAGFARKWLDPFEGSVVRSHVIHLEPGGYFPTHRDDFRDEITTMRIFIPLQNCNPDDGMWFMLEDKALQFKYGRSYFINTCLSHTVFSTLHSYFLVMNVEVNKNSYMTIMKHMSR